MADIVKKLPLRANRKICLLLYACTAVPARRFLFRLVAGGFSPQITDNLLMVYWDQLGCGINNRKIDNSFAIEHFAQMTVDLIKELKVRFPQNKLFLFGMSWGSILALHAALQVPELINGVVTCGQVITAPMLSDNAFDAVEKSSAPEKKKKLARELRLKRENFSLKEMMAFSQIIRKYTNGYNNKATKPAPVGNIIKGLLSGPDYRFKDFVAIVNNGYAKNESLLREMASADLSALLGKITIPYHIFQGETDIVTDTESVVKLVDGLNNKNVSCTVLPNVGHFPSEDAMSAIFEKIMHMVSA